MRLPALLLTAALLKLGSTINCPELVEMPFSKLKMSGPSPFKPGTTATFICDKGFKSYKKPKITCKNNGRWSGSLLVCKAYKCRKVLRKLETNRKCGEECEHDGNCKGVLKRCECDDWCGKSCINPNSKCRSLSPPKNGYIIGKGRSYSHTVMYGCNDGYVLAGPSLRMCRSDKEWSGQEPRCVRFSTCGQNDLLNEISTSGKVIHGENAKRGAWPWQALLIFNIQYLSDQIYNVKAGFGGGSVINEHWILSAAHVFDEFHAAHINKNWKDYFLIIVGMTAYPQDGEEVPEHVHVYQPHSVHFHSAYNKYSFDHDVALIRVGKRLVQGRGGKFVIDDKFPEEKLLFSRFIRPVCLPCIKTNPIDTDDTTKKYETKYCNSTASGTSVMVTGFGRKSKPGGRVLFSPKILQQGRLTVWKNTKCIKSVKELQQTSPSVRFTKQMLCASGGDASSQTDSCQGDSGGPLVEMVEEKQYRFWQQIGIVSWGEVKCFEKHPGFYTSVRSIMPWLTEVLEKTRPVITCRMPQIENGKVYASDGLMLGSKLIYQCNTGFAINGSSLATCTKNGISEKTPVCKIKFCPSPPSLWNGEATARNYTYGSIVKYSCNPGYRLIGSTEGSCGDDGNWGDKPKCTIKFCGPPLLLRNGESKAMNHAYGSIVEYSCNVGYELKGNNKGYCEDDGSWGELPTCEEFSGKLQCYSIIRTKLSLTGTIVSDTKEIVECDKGSRCLYSNINSNVAQGGLEIQISVNYGSCVPESLCSANVCDTTPTNEFGTQGMTLISCDASCCNENLCNDFPSVSIVQQTSETTKPLQCYSIYRSILSDTNTVVSNTKEVETCEPNSRCIYADTTARASLSGIDMTVGVSYGTCVPAATCETDICNFLIANSAEQRTMDLTYTSCKASCCNRNLCNDGSSLAAVTATTG